MTRKSVRRWLLLAAAVMIGLVALYELLLNPATRPDRAETNGEAAKESTASDPAVASESGSAPAHDPCRFVTKGQVEAILESKLVLEVVENGCRFDPVDETARGAVYSIDPYDEAAYNALTSDGTPVGGLGEKAAAVRVASGTQLLIKKGPQLLIVIVGGSGSGDFETTRRRAIALAEALLLKI